ncbi:MAG TPA: DUF2911 domain-containing protein [Candidatus Acidoferrales bacterium]|nr:DUF2911 domain-containing protein [Candidatus Acidoferrales bacterium]
MKLFLTCAAAVLAAAGLASAQSITESKSIGGKTLSVTYFSPKVKGRVGKLFGKDGTIGQDSTYPVWRAGANDATAFHTDANLDVAGLAVPKGDYTLFVDLTAPDNWQLIINKQTGQAGLDYDKAQDLGRVKMTMSKPPALVESLKFTIAEAGGNKAKLTLEWENHSASVAIMLK